ncbi:methyl-accepting chemotaxis protein [Pseudomarimonas arenosa]|uniref:Histidine kinase n=1 Tax=Pseudomarimonas arenosa TaxID=2774145 RepID=A0AAW3ZKZ0_9GAMM|nr:methyl-accepting chemotaxis protein [Pseudomarimonas arenosa]MBD8526770.1 histidine kinase [Pseudomarimonas arenosa]
MLEHWTVGRRIAAGFILTSVLVATLALIALWTLNHATERKDFLIEVMARNESLAAEAHETLIAHGTAMRGYLITRDTDLLNKAEEERRAFRITIEALRSRMVTDQGKAYVKEAEAAEAALHTEFKHLLSLDGDDRNAMLDAFDARATPLMMHWDETWIGYRSFVRDHTAQQQAEVSQDLAAAQRNLTVLAISIVLLSILISWYLTRYVTQRVGSAVAQLQSTSAQLQTAANEQATSSREQTTAMNEVSTTLKELVATARQMAETTQRVSRAADDTSQAAKLGDRTVSSAQSVFESVQRQVNLIVSHMVELGKKSQQIGSIQELINELAEQTNILSINATIESAGAGEAGKRFAVVAEEIRKLADRVAASGREIRNLVDEIRSAANTTVMVTEDGSKAVDAGMHSFSQVATQLAEIRRMVDSASEASRQIELGTRQQVTAVEQVNLTLADLTQAAKESDAGTRQTLEGVEYLNRLARDLVRMTSGNRR